MLFACEAVVCLLAAPLLQVSIKTGSGWWHDPLQWAIETLGYVQYISWMNGWCKRRLNQALDSFSFHTVG